MLRKFWRKFTGTLNPIVSYIMIGVIGLFSVAVAYALSQTGFDFLSTKYKIPTELFGYIIPAFSVLIFILFCAIVIAFQTLFEGHDIEFEKEVAKERKRVPYLQDKEIYEITIPFPIKNRDKHKNIICYVEYTNFEIVYSEIGWKMDKLMNEILKNEFLVQQTPRLQWINGYQLDDCKIEIPPQKTKNIELAKVRIHLMKSLESNKPIGDIAVNYCGNNGKSLSTLLGLYKTGVSVTYEKDDEITTKDIDWYFYVKLNELRPNKNVGNDIRNRIEYEVIVGSGDPMKNKDVPKPKE